MTNYHCILRTRGSSTLRLARSLDAAGYEVWTPTEIQDRRKRHSSAKSEIIVAVMPTYVFAAADRLTDLLIEADSDISGHPSFSVFKYHDRFPLIADEELNSLRAIERKAAAKHQPVRFETHQNVRTPDGPFQGLTGQVVETSRGEFTLVAFPGFNIPVKFASWKLEKAA